MGLLLIRRGPHPLTFNQCCSSVLQVVLPAVAMSQLITVFGATGHQGKSVALALLAKGYKVRALTRNPDGAGGKALQEKGCEVVKVEMDDKESLEKALSGAYGVFAVTNYWGMLAEDTKTAFDREVSQGKAIGDICKKNGVKHLVYSGLEHVQEIIGKSCLHFDGKGIVEKYLDEIKVPNTSTRVAYYYENFISIPPQKGDDGTYTTTWPMDGPMDGICVSDLGGAVATIFGNPDKYIGQKVGLSGDKMTMHEYAAIISKVTGKTLKYNQVPPDVFAKFPFPGADDAAAMFEFYSTGKCVRDIDLTRTLNPDTANFEQWAVDNKDKLLA